MNKNTSTKAIIAPTVRERGGCQVLSLLPCTLVAPSKLSSESSDTKDNPSESDTFVARESARLRAQANLDITRRKGGGKTHSLLTKNTSADNGHLLTTSIATWPRERWRERGLNVPTRRQQKIACTFMEEGSGETLFYSVYRFEVATVHHFFEECAASSLR